MGEKGMKSLRPSKFSIPRTSRDKLQVELLITLIEIYKSGIYRLRHLIFNTGVLS